MKYRKFRYNDKFPQWLGDCTSRDGVYYIVKEEEDGYRVTCTCNNFQSTNQNPSRYLMVNKDCVQIIPDIQRRLPNWF